MVKSRKIKACFIISAERSGSEDSCGAPSGGGGTAIRIYVKSQNPFKMSFKLKLRSFVSVPSLFKKEINAFDSFAIEGLVIRVLSVDVEYLN